MNVTGLLARRERECARWDALYPHRLFIRRARAGMIVLPGESLWLVGNHALKRGGAR